MTVQIFHYRYNLSRHVPPDRVENNPSARRPSTGAAGDDCDEVMKSRSALRPRRITYPHLETFAHDTEPLGCRVRCVHDSIYSERARFVRRLRVSSREGFAMAAIKSCGRALSRRAARVPQFRDRQTKDARNKTRVYERDCERECTLSPLILETRGRSLSLSLFLSSRRL